MTVMLKLEDYISNSWRYVSPTVFNINQDFRDAFSLRNRNNVREKDVSFFLNKDSCNDDELRLKDALTVIDKKLKITDNSHLLNVDLLNAVDEANMSCDFLKVEMGKFPHCSMYYLNSSYDDPQLRGLVTTILVSNIRQQYEVMYNRNDDTSKYYIELKSS